MESQPLFRIIVEKQAAKDFKKYRQYEEAIMEAIEWLKRSPTFGPNIKTLTNFHCKYRYRIGNLRLFYNVINEEIVVVIVGLEPRGGAYKKR